MLEIFGQKMEWKSEWVPDGAIDPREITATLPAKSVGPGVGSLTVWAVIGSLIVAYQAPSTEDRLAALWAFHRDSQLPVGGFDGPTYGFYQNFTVCNLICRRTFLRVSRRRWSSRDPRPCTYRTPSAPRSTPRSGLPSQPLFLPRPLPSR